MKSVLLSIQPQWCELIASGKKTIEVRKTKPKLDTPFKCYMYMTKDAKKRYYIDEYLHVQVELIPQKIIGEFVCDGIDKYTAEFVEGDDCYEDIQYHYLDVDGDEQGIIAWSNDESFDKCFLLKDSQLTYDELKRYVGVNFHDKPFYGWHISDLIIYDKPRELREFYRICPEWGKDDFPNRCRSCNHYNNCADDVAFDGKVMLTRPPQSWCYIAPPGGECL